VLGGFLFNTLILNGQNFEKIIQRGLATGGLSEPKPFLQIRLSETEFMASYLSVEFAAGVIDRAEGASVCIILKDD